MDINYKTKFNIGDTIYLIEIFEGGYYVDGPHKIKSIKLEIVKDGILVRYHCENVCIDPMESHCFTSKEECQKWCAEHN